MTICASVKVRDGVVLATDSMAQLYMRDENGQMHVAKTYSNARKLFQIKKLPVGIMSYGAANIGERSIEGLVLEFSEQTSEKEIEKIGNSFLGFLRIIYDEALGDRSPEEGPPVGFFLAGYSPKSPFPEEWEFVLPEDSQVREVRPKTAFGASWRGVSIPFTRLYYGFDPRTRQLFEDLNVPEDARRAVFDEERFKITVPYQAMPVQDAINFAEFVVRTTIGLSSIEIGVPSCGGPLQVAVILSESGFEWVTERRFTIGGGSYG